MFKYIIALICISAITSASSYLSAVEKSLSVNQQGVLIEASKELRLSQLKLFSLELNLLDEITFNLSKIKKLK